MGEGGLGAAELPRPELSDTQQAQAQLPTGLACIDAMHVSDLHRNIVLIDGNRYLSRVLEHNTVPCDCRYCIGLDPGKSLVCLLTRRFSLKNKSLRARRIGLGVWA